MHRRQKSIVQRHQFWRRRTPPMYARRKSLQRRHQVCLLKHHQVVSHGFKRAFVLKLPLQLLQRDNLRRRSHRNREYLPQQHGARRTAPKARRSLPITGSIIAALTYPPPARGVGSQLHRPRVRPELHQAQSRVIVGQMKRAGQRRGGPVAERRSLEAPSQALTRSCCHAQGGGASGDDVQWQMPPTPPIPLSLETCRPIGKMTDLIQHQDGSAPLSAGFGFGPATLPEAGQCRGLCQREADPVEAEPRRDTFRREVGSGVCFGHCCSRCSKQIARREVLART